MLYKCSINDYDVVSFDVFDTLIKRLVINPSDIFSYIEKSDIKYKRFCETRIKAEKEARELSCAEEVTLKEIYARIPSGYGWNIDDLINLEIKTEINSCIPNYPMINFFNNAVKAGKKILLISDMYLDHDIIIRMLKKCGIINYDKLFVSSTYGVCKYSGNIYKLIKNEQDIDYKKWLHIGDNLISDYTVPKKLGMSAYLYKEKTRDYKDVIKKDSCFYAMMFCRYIELNSKKIDNKVEEMAYRVYGPILFGFFKWISDEVTKNKIGTILFLARDSYVLKKLYDMVFKNTNVKSRYLLVSRKSLWLSSFKGEVDIKEFYERIITEFPVRFKLKLVIEELELDSSNICFDESLDYEVCRNKALHDSHFLNFYNCIQDCLNKRSMEDYQGFLQYVRHLKISMRDKVAIVDIGWRGTMQMMLETILCKELYGYYYGINNEKYNLKYAFSYDKECLNKNNGLTTFLELFFSAEHGSIIRYLLNADGTVGFRFKQNEHSDNIKNVLMNMRNTAICFVNDCYKNDCINKMEISSKVATDNLINQLENPSYDEVKIYENISFYDVVMLRFIKRHTLLKYLKHPRMFFCDYRESIWKIGFLKSVFRINLPYYELLFLIRKGLRIVRRIVKN